jgi:hypothetical protein
MKNAWTCLATAIALAFLAIPLMPRLALAGACSCEHVSALKTEIARALQLRDRHAAKRDEIIKKLGANPQYSAVLAAKEDYLRFETGSGPGSAAEGLPPVASDAPQAVQYTPRGAALLEAHAADSRNGIPLYDDFPPGGDTRVKDVKKRKAEEDKWKKAKKDLCDFKDEKAVKESTAAGAACDGIARAALVHEQTHRATCQKMGFYAFWERGPADLAADEVRAYEAELAVLSSEMARVLKAKTTRVIRAAAGACPQCYLNVEAECIRAYDVSGGLGGVQIKDRVCNIYESYTLTSRGQSKVLFQMAPTNNANGQYVYSGTGGGATFAGEGSFSVALSDKGGTLTMNSDGIATVNGQEVKDGGSVDLKMTPLEKPCGE